MNKLEQAARQALEALESYSKSDYIKKQHPKRKTNGEKAITALREALAEQAEQKPIRFVWNGEGWVEADEYIWKTTPDAERRELYTAPQPDMNLNCKSVQKRLATSWGYVKAEQQEQVAEWEKLKDPQTLFVNLNRGFPAQLTHDHLLHLLNKTEQAEQEPVNVDAINTSSKYVDEIESNQHEPVAWVNKERTQSIEWLKIAPEHGTKLYAAPVRTKDLTDDEIEELMKQPFNQTKYLEQFARAVIAADRRKNK